MRKIALIGSLLLLCANASGAAYGPIFQRRTDTPNLGNATIGRYLYLGTAPRFQSGDLEVYASKVGLTVRAKGWISYSQIRNYQLFLLERWNKIDQALRDSAISVEPLESVDSHMARARTASQLAWLKIAKQYMAHALEISGQDLFNGRPMKQGEYKALLSRSILRYFMNRDQLELNDGLKMLTRLRANPESGAADSEALFQFHLGDRYTPDLNRLPEGMGFVTFVYPIAASAEGPFKDPAEGVFAIGNDTYLESRWWSDKYKDLYGGFPFLGIDGDGHAFHGPISNQKETEAWFLRRDFVSHGCFRMDPSDIMEFRALMPSVLRPEERTGDPVRVFVTEWLDVTDLENDGELRAVDVAYYDIPLDVSVGAPHLVDAAIAPYLLAESQRTFWRQHLSAFDRLLPANQFDPEAQTVTGIPKYSFNASQVSRTGYHDPIKLKTLPIRKTAIIQYREAGAQLTGYDDRSGKYPMEYFQSP
jgi:hypothetical protein